MEKSPSRWWDLPSAGIFILAILFSVWRLTVTDWTDNLGYVINLAVAGAIIGLALGASRFRRGTAFWLGMGYTLVFIPRQLLAFYPGDIYIGERLISVGGRLLFSLGEFMADRPVEDPIFFITLIGILYWFVALVPGWHLTRHNNALAAILPAGLVMMVIHQADWGNPERILIIAFYFFAALSLVGRVKYLRDRAGWIERGVHITPETGSDMTMGTLVAAASLIILAWNMPLNFSAVPALEEKWREVTRPWRATRDRLDRAFDALEGQSAAERTEYFRGTMGLGTHAAQGSEAVFQVTAPLEALELPRLYWRARVYDRYENANWSESPPATRQFSPEGGELSIPNAEERQAYEFTIRSFTQGQAILSMPAEPLWISRPVDIFSYPIPDGTQDVIFFQTFPYLEPGETYRVRSALANPSVLELRAAGEDYPAWTARYLQLPENFSPRVSDVAEQIVFRQATPYDKAQAITTFLRNHIEYQPSISLPARGTDIMEWFLFEGRQGYCNYYATAEVLMLRSLGIPARLAVGFAQGNPIEGPQRPGEVEITEQEFAVSRKHTHAWPEVYFPGIGWVEFEPTSNQDPLIRPAAPREEPAPILPVEIRKNLPELTPQESPAEKPDSPGFQFPDLKTGLSLLLWSAALSLLGAALYYANRRYALATLAAQYVLTTVERRGGRGPAWLRNAALYILADPFERAFHSVNASLRRLGISPDVHFTPAERAVALKELMPEAGDEIEILSREYQIAQFSPRKGDLGAARHAGIRIFWQGVRGAIRRAQRNSRW